MTTPQLPAEGIMIQKEFTDASIYTVACDCGDHDHSVQMWIEAKAEEDVDDVSLTFYVTATNPWWNSTRWKQIWQLLTKGYIKQEATVILSKQGALNLSTVIRNCVNKLSKSK